jgi:hypothetical protein
MDSGSSLQEDSNAIRRKKIAAKGAVKRFIERNYGEQANSKPGNLEQE